MLLVEQPHYRTNGTGDLSFMGEVVDFVMEEWPEPYGRQFVRLFNSASIGRDGVESVVVLGVPDTNYTLVVRSADIRIEGQRNDVVAMLPAFWKHYLVASAFNGPELIPIYCGHRVRHKGGAYVGGPRDGEFFYDDLPVEYDSGRGVEGLKGLQ